MNLISETPQGIKENVPYDTTQMVKQRKLYNSESIDKTKEQNLQQHLCILI